MNTLFSPAIRLARRFRIAHKVSFIAVAFAIPLLIVVGLLIAEMSQGVRAAAEKRDALGTIQQQEKLIAALTRLRGLQHRQIMGNKELAEPIRQTEQSLAAFSENPQNKALLDALQQSIRQDGIKAPAVFAAYSKTIHTIREQQSTIAQQAKLSLDSDAMNHSLASLSLQALPALREKVDVMTARGAAYIDSGLFEAGEDVMLNSLAMQANNDIAALLQTSAALKERDAGFAAEHEQIQKISDLTRRFFERAKDEVLASVNQTSGKEFSEAGEQVLNALQQTQQQTEQQLSNRLTQEQTALQLRMLEIVAGIIVLTLIAAYLLAGMYIAFSADIRQLTHNLQETAAGNLHDPVPVNGQDELSALLSAIADMRHGLSQMVENIRHSALEIDSIAHEIHQENTDLAERTAHQADSVQKTSSAISQLTSSTQENAANLAQANAVIAGTATQVQEGLNVMQSAIESMQSVTHSANLISDIINVMDGIAFQTNILALNAAVEAARAGQEGRGFAVVASEVRSLAQRSAEAAKEIKQLIDRSGQAISRGNDMIEAAGSSMSTIAQDVAQVSALIEQIAGAGREQSAGISSVNDTIASIDSITQHNASLVSEAARSAAQLESEAAALSAAISAFRPATEHGHASGFSIQPAAAKKLLKGKQGAQRTNPRLA
ncbi:methyl-accepting chemotaxis protein [Undibacterium squillarum]|uniref:Methyl-accepting chemotaxis protein n=1 Tax=Undibacterium squillarum TaxID=1131567 RepID=A0ABQ2XTP8_9BURK|nr:methyl-accepting chemotaxis protein [Undibacterium squillarum]GGX32139.1 methyl-accepting chemotaxis protein [Undibacterium squillarum]